MDIALVDLKMPGINGEETLRALKKEHQWMEIVILTGHGSIDSAVECTKDGAYSLFTKAVRSGRSARSPEKCLSKRVMNKNAIEEKRMNDMLKVSQSSSPRDILRRLNVNRRWLSVA